MEYLYHRSSHSAYVLDEDITDTSEGLVYVADLKTSEIFTFGGSAAIIWCALEEPKNLEKIVEDVALAFEERPEVVRPGVESFLIDLVDRTLLEKSLAN